MDSNFGAVNFAPTGDNALMGGKNAQLAGVPQAIQVLSMALPRILGARPVVPSALATAPGSQGDPAASSALMQTLLKVLGLPGGFHGGTAGPNQLPVPVPNESGPELPYTPPTDPGLSGLSPTIDTKPHVIFQGPPNAGPGPFPPAPRPGLGGFAGGFAPGGTRGV